MGHYCAERNHVMYYIWLHDNKKELWCPGERNDQSYTAIISGESTIEQRPVKIWQFDCFERLKF
jgi:hypothetical protein